MLRSSITLFQLGALFKHVFIRLRCNCSHGLPPRFISAVYVSVHGDKLNAVSIGTVCPRSTDFSCVFVADPPDTPYTVSLGTRRGVVD